jgi:hypothetical protein
MWRAELRVRYKPGLAAGRVLGVMVVVLRLLLVVVGVNCFWWSRLRDETFLPVVGVSF